MNIFDPFGDTGAATTTGDLAANLRTRVNELTRSARCSDRDEAVDLIAGAFGVSSSYVETLLDYYDDPNDESAISRFGDDPELVAEARLRSNAAHRSATRWRRLAVILAAVLAALVLTGCPSTDSDPHDSVDPYWAETQPRSWWETTGAVLVASVAVTGGSVAAILRRGSTDG